jgi:hypothetical protein
MIPFSMASFSPSLLFLTRVLKIYRILTDLFMGIEVSAFGNGALSENRHSRADAQWAPLCAATDLGF